MNEPKSGLDVEKEARAPWLTAPSIHCAQLILHSFRYWLNRDLIAVQGSERAQAEQLFEAPLVVLAHGAGPDPRFIYGNRMALALFERDWHEHVHLPSRLSALPDARADRHRDLQDALRRGYATGYSGVRVSATGKRFRIEDVMLWKIVNASGSGVGQAAAFSKWRGL